MNFIKRGVTRDITDDAPLALGWGVTTINLSLQCSLERRLRLLLQPTCDEKPSRDRIGRTGKHTTNQWLGLVCSPRAGQYGTTRRSPKWGRAELTRNHVVPQEARTKRLVCTSIIPSSAWKHLLPHHAWCDVQSSLSFSFSPDLGTDQCGHISEANGTSCVAAHGERYACAVAFAIYEEVSRTLQVRRNNPGLERKVAWLIRIRIVIMIKWSKRGWYMERTNIYTVV